MAVLLIIKCSTALIFQSFETLIFFLYHEGGPVVEVGLLLLITCNLADKKL